MELKNFFAQDDAGNILSEATCYLYERGTENLVDGLWKPNGVALSNPFATDHKGLTQFAAANGQYDLRVVKGDRDSRILIQFNDVTDTLAESERAADRAEASAVKAADLLLTRTTNVNWNLVPSLSVSQDDLFGLMVTALAGTGFTVTLLKGNYRITRKHVISGFTLKLEAGAEIEVNGADGAAFNDGALKLVSNGYLKGRDGVVYTSGTMTAVPGSVVVIQDGGYIDGPTIYSQLDEVVRHTKGHINVTVVGGHGRGLRSMLNQDAPIRYKVGWHNCGIRYVNKVPSAVLNPDCRAFHIYNQIPISSSVRVFTDGKYCFKNGAWIGGALAPMSDVVIRGVVQKSGFYLDASGVEQPGHGAGTNIEMQNCPGGVIRAVTKDPRGYNIAIVGGSHGAKLIGGSHIQAGVGDPVIVVADSHDVVISSYSSGGSVGVSVGEDGATSDNCRILGHVFNNHKGNPIGFEFGNNLTVAGCTVLDEPSLVSATGSWTGPGEVKAVVRVGAGAQHVDFTGNSLSGWFTHDVIDRSGVGRLRVTRGADSGYNAPILPREDIGYAPLHRKTLGGTPLLRLIEGDTDTSGHAGVGEITILAGDAQQYKVFSLNSALRNVVALAAPGETLDDVLSRYAVLVYVRYEAAAQGKRLTMGITGGGSNVSQTGSAFAGVYSAISTVLHPLVSGQEWVPLTMSLKEIIYPLADKTNLLQFFVRKLDGGDLYDLHMTKPVLFFIGRPPKME